MVQFYVGFRNWALIPVALAAAACSGGGSGDLMSKTDKTLSVTSEAFRAGQAIPAKCTADGGNRSPALHWTAAPSDSKSIAVIVDDSDANGYAHWLLFNLPPETTGLPEGVPRGGPLNSLGNAMQGRNSHGEPGYFGPQPPPGSPHHYHFHVYALDRMLPLNPGASKDDVIRAMSSHVLAQGEVTGVYQSG
ncbi:MAG TPA: YbhB/YbcL family Raf kinase inhibitor-like protein [Fimbriimonadaceae bacterium]|nr:YbhB/YbcL family Raf kinase inhibitor-like protein [Fimbriimonadaceae bacterium]